MKVIRVSLAQYSVSRYEHWVPDPASESLAVVSPINFSSRGLRMLG